jgi:hypothetical protein
MVLNHISKLATIASLSMLFCLASGMEQKPVITKENLTLTGQVQEALLEQWSQDLRKNLPQANSEQQETITKWTEDNKSLLLDLRTLGKPSMEARTTKNSAIEAAGMNNRSNWNYVLLLPSKKLIAKIPGDVNRYQNTITQLDILNETNLRNTTLTAEDKANIYKTATKILTYQGISRAIRYLALAQAMEELHGVHVPATYLAQYADADSMNIVSDNTHFPIEEVIDITGESLDQEGLQKLNDYTLRNLLKACEKGYLWCLDNENIRIQKDGTLVLMDLEGRNVQNAAEAWLQDPRGGQIVCGLEGMKIILNWAAPHQWPIIAHYLLHQLPEEFTQHSHYKGAILPELKSRGLVS